MAPHMPRRQVLTITLLMVVALALSASPSSAGPPDPEEVRVAILSRAQRSHREAAATLQQGLRHTGYESILIELPAGVDEPAEDVIRYER